LTCCEDYVKKPGSIKKLLTRQLLSFYTDHRNINFFLESSRMLIGCRDGHVLNFVENVLTILKENVKQAYSSGVELRLHTR
jgi:hypothetical protein